VDLPGSPSIFSHISSSFSESVEGNTWESINNNNN